MDKFSKLESVTFGKICIHKDWTNCVAVQTQVGDQSMHRPTVLLDLVEAEEFRKTLDEIINVLETKKEESIGR